MIRRRPLAIQLAVWTTYGLLRYLAALPAVDPGERAALALADLVRAGTGFAVTSALGPVLLPRFDPARARSWGLAALTVVLAALGWAMIDRAILVTVAAASGIAIPWDRFPRGFELEHGLVLAAWTAAALAFRLRERERAAREEALAERLVAREAQLRALAARLEPHFLFNSLNAVRSLVIDDPARARETVTRLAAFLRHTATTDPATPVPLAEEIESARTWLRIEEARFEHDLEARIDVTSSAERALVPPLLLQPLLENAIRHGEPDDDGVRRIRLEAGLEPDGELQIEIHNTGALRPDEPGEGLGLELTRSRLGATYGPAARIELGGSDGWVRAAIRIAAPRFDTRSDERGET